MNAVTSTLGKPSKPGAFKWLIKREFWENRGGFFWAPVITGGIFLVLNLILAVIGSIAARRSMDGGGFVIDDAPEKAHQIVGGIGDGMLLGGVILACVVLAFVVFFYALGTLYDDRHRDRGVLFWKSLPVSDTHMVLSKLAWALVLGAAAGHRYRHPDRRGDVADLGADHHRQRPAGRRRDVHPPTRCV